MHEFPEAAPESDAPIDGLSEESGAENDFLRSEQVNKAPATDPGPSPRPSFWSRLAQQWRAFLSDQVSPIRLASHAALLLVAALVLLLSRVHLPQWDVVHIAPDETDAAAAEVAAPPFNLAPVGGSPFQESGVLLRAPVPFTEISDHPRTEVITYTVQVEDTILGIAEKFHLNPNTIVWSNQELTDNPFLLEVGQQLFILPVDGVYHTVKEGDSIKKIASRYRVTPEKIVEFAPNGLSSVDDPLTPGQMLVVPDGDATPPEPPARKAAKAPWRSRNFIWPAYGRLTQGFWLPAHPAIDIGAHQGASVVAADDGTVIQAGWSSYGYGNMVMIRHYDGAQTLYAHLSRIDVSPGEVVSRGQQIGLVGSTGRSTGPHLHFEVIIGGRNYNPLLYLP